MNHWWLFCLCPGAAYPTLPPSRPAPYTPPSHFGVFPLLSLPPELLLLVAAQLEDPRCFRALSESCRSFEDICRIVKPPQFDETLSDEEAKRKSRLLKSAVTAMVVPERCRDVEPKVQMLRACLERGRLGAEEILETAVVMSGNCRWSERVLEVLIRAVGVEGVMERAREVPGVQGLWLQKIGRVRARILREDAGVVVVVQRRRKRRGRGRQVVDGDCKSADADIANHKDTDK